MGNTSWDTGDIVKKGVVMVSVFFLATAARGEWLLFFVYLGRDYLQQLVQPMPDAGSNLTEQSQGEAAGSLLQRLGLVDLHLHVIAAVTVSFVIFWGVGLSFDRYFYRNRKHVAETWKCQPDRWLTPANEWHEFILGSTNMFIGSVISGVIACYIMNGGKNSLYTDINEYGWVYTALSVPAVFVYNEFVSYYIHRLLHCPLVYRNIHKHHHRYGSPTLYSTTAMHPLEFLWLEGALAIPVFLVPLHPAVFVGNLLYGYYYGMMDHSGIKMDAVWPWQPSSMFHDDHHRYFHCNFGFNALFFDRFHGTLRKKHFKYGETVFGGGGKATGSLKKSPEYLNYK